MYLYFFIFVNFPGLLLRFEKLTIKVYGCASKHLTVGKQFLKLITHAGKDVCFAQILRSYMPNAITKLVRAKLGLLQNLNILYFELILNLEQPYSTIK
jgi:hypothetical protein